MFLFACSKLGYLYFSGIPGILKHLLNSHYNIGNLEKSLPAEKIPAKE